MFVDNIIIPIKEWDHYYYIMQSSGDVYNTWIHVWLTVYYLKTLHNSLGFITAVKNGFLAMYLCCVKVLAEKPKNVALKNDGCTRSHNDRFRFSYKIIKIKQVMQEEVCLH